MKLSEIDTNNLDNVLIKKVKELHSVFFIALSAVVGILFHFN